jgi:hypothetical protein
MLQIKNQYKGVNVEYLLGTVRVTKKIEDLTEKNIETAQKWGINLGKYFDEVTENTELPTEQPTILPTIAYEGVDQSYTIEFNAKEIEKLVDTYAKPKRKKK